MPPLSSRTPHQMDMTASTVRRVLYEGSDAGFLYPIGNTSPSAVLPAVDDDHSPRTCKVLLLGCGDVRNALATAAALCSRGAATATSASTSRRSSSGGNKSGTGQHRPAPQPQAQIHLNDISDAILARDVLLLAVAASMDPDRPDDLHFLWSLWFNAVLSQQQHSRLQQLLQQALDNQLPSCVVLADGNSSSTTSSRPDSSSSASSLKQRLDSIWSSWQRCSKTTSALGAQRRAFMLSHAKRRGTLAGQSEITWEKLVASMSLASRVDDVVVDCYCLDAASKATLAREIGVFARNGSIDCSGCPCQGPAVNPTLLDEQGEWRVHDGSSPFICLGPFNVKKPQPQGAAATSSPGLLTQSAQATLQQMVLSFQKATRLADDPDSGKGGSSRGSSTAVQFVLHGGDGLALMAAGSSLGDEVRFDAIDCSNVADHAGLLNVLVACGPRLNPKPWARLFVTSMNWATSGTKSMSEYLNQALGASTTLLPALLGLRLCSDLRFGRLEPYSEHDRIATQSATTRQLEFAPAAASAAAVVKLMSEGNQQQAASSSSSSSFRYVQPGSGEVLTVAADLAASTVEIPLACGTEASTSSSRTVSQALQQLQELSCLQTGISRGKDRSGLILQTTATLVRLLASACVHKRLQLRFAASPGGAGRSAALRLWRDLNKLSEAWRIPPQHHLAWRSAWDWLLQAAEAAAAAADDCTLSPRSGCTGSRPSSNDLPAHGEDAVIITAAAPPPAAPAAAAAAAAAENNRCVRPQPLLLTGLMDPLLNFDPRGRLNTPVLCVLLLTAAAMDALVPAAAAPGSSMRDIFPDFLLQAASAMGLSEHTQVIHAMSKACTMLAAGQQLPAAAAAGVSVIDSVSVVASPTDVDWRPMKVTFLLPADHGLNPDTTWVGLVQQEWGDLRCSPMKLAQFNSSPLLAPSPLLLPPAAESSGDRDASSSSSNGNVSGDSNDCSAGGVAGQKSLRLTELHETADAYTAVIQVLGPGSSSSSCSGLRVRPVSLVQGAVAAAAAGDPVHELELSLQQPSGLLPYKLRLLHPVLANRAKYKLSRASRTITAQLPKSTDPDFPCDLASPSRPGLIVRLQVERLPVLEDKLFEWGWWMSEMFTHEEMAVQAAAGPAGNADLLDHGRLLSSADLDVQTMSQLIKVRQGAGGLGEPFYDLRETLKILFLCTIKGERVYQIKHPMAAMGSQEDKAIMYIMVHTPMLRSPCGRPLAVLSVVDTVLAEELVEQGRAVRQRELHKFSEVIMRAANEAPSGSGIRTCFCSRREVQLLRALLLRNSRRMQPTPWQQNHLDLGPESCWMATYVCPVYPETLGDSKTFVDAIPNSIMKQAEEALHSLKNSSSCSSSSTPAAAGTTSGAKLLAMAGSSSGCGAAAGQKVPPSAAALAASADTRRAAAGPTVKSVAVNESGNDGSGCSCRSCGCQASGSVQLMRCGRCKSSADWYCSQECQRRDWRRHKLQCRPAAEG